MERCVTAAHRRGRCPPPARPDPVPVGGFFVAGTLPPEDRPRVAIVGSRAPSAGGERTTYALARGLAAAGVVVVSGLARGIDAAAHRGALDGGGVTVAFLGCGLDVVYPRSSRRLAEEIPARGALVSEYEPGAPPLPYRFVERNRLVAAYTAGTLVVEAGAKSGALITAGSGAWSWGGSCGRCPAIRAGRARGAATGCCATARGWCSTRSICWRRWVCSRGA